MSADLITSNGEISSDDLRFMAAAIRYSRRNLGLTSTNPSVGTLIVKDNGYGPVIVGRGVTALGGRPHAEREALREAGENARGATAYVTLEPCAHHGKTPPCAEALISAGIARVVAAANDPDERVSGKGYKMLRDAGIRVDTGVLADVATNQLAGYLIRSFKKKPEVTVKLALSSDGFIGVRGSGQVAITGSIARSQSHLMRAETDAILVGIATALEDDPELTCRLDGMAHRSPVRIVLDNALRLPLTSKLVQTAGHVPLWIACGCDVSQEKRIQYQNAGCHMIATDTSEGMIALPELLNDLAELGIATLLVEGGATLAASFLREGLADRLVLFKSPVEIGAGGIPLEGLQHYIDNNFIELRSAEFGADHYAEYVRKC
ncbi:bifunctional diaminohydroxyphosphoribosylaminopyrimidine deaminase/5-amino-6-(5-phosphoribosylamino)uracil reductase RibD [Brucellaceae bacterium C25G]